MLQRSTQPGMTLLRRPTRLACASLLMFSLLALAAGLFALHAPARNTHASGGTPGKMPVGLNIDINEQSLNDMIEYDPRFGGVNNGTLTEDANGDLSSDFQWTLDNRYVFAWTPGATNIDPLKKSTDLSGDYTLTFTGQATLTATGDDPAHMSTTISNQSYDPSTNTTTATVTFGNPAGGLLSVINFTNTKRNPSDTAGNGVTNLHLWRPGYKTASNPIFTDLWLNSIKNYNWSALRFMAILGTNDYAGYTTPEVYPYRLNWNTDRLQPGKGPAYGYNHVGVHGSISWEEVVIIGQLTHKDLWINIPVNASDDYVNQLATLFKNGNQYTNNQGIPDDVNVYVEYSNEMWHFGFYQGSWNLQAAKDEVAAGGSNLNYDGNTGDPIRFRRMAKRTLEIGHVFKQAFNDNGTRIRPVVNNAWVGNDADMLNYVNANYGAPSTVLYGIAQTTYYSSTDRSSVQSILNTMKTSSDSNVKTYTLGRAMATYFGLHLLAYEGGEGDTSDGNKSDQDLYNQFAATRDPGMQDVEMHDLNNWFNSGGEMYMQFGQVTRYATYGFWGLSDDLTIQDSGKWKGYIQAMNTPTPAFNAGNPVAASGATSIAFGHGDLDNGNFGTRPDTGSEVYYLLNVAQAGTYDVSITTSQWGPDNGGMGQAQVFINNHEVGGATNMPPSSTIDFGSVQLQAGANTIRVYAVHGTADPAYPNDTFHDQWSPVNLIFTPNGSGTGTFSSGFESSDPQPDWTNTVDTNGGGGISNIGGVCCGLSGPEAGVRNETHHTGSSALMYSGMATSASGSDYAYMQVFDLSGKNITVGSNTTLEYWIYPQSSATSGYVSGNNSSCVAIDLVFSDGSNLRDSGAVDQNGNRAHPAHQCGHLQMDSWNHVIINLGANNSGKTIKHLDVAYDQPNSTGGYRGYIDDVSIHN